MGPRNHVLEGGQDRTNPFAATRGDKSAMRPFAKLLWTRVEYGVIIFSFYGTSRGCHRAPKYATVSVHPEGI